MTTIFPKIPIFERNILGYPVIALIIGEGAGTFLRPKFFRLFFTFSSKRELFSKVLRIFAHNMKPNIIEDQIFEFELFEEDGLEDTNFFRTFIRRYAK